MKKVVISADSAADLPREIAEEYGIHLMPMNVIISGTERKDGIDINSQEIFDYVKNTGETPKTSAVSPGEYHDYFKKLLNGADGVVHLSFCSQLSSTCRNAKMAAAAFGNVHVVDTLNLGGGIALPAIKACRMRDNGADADEILEMLAEKLPSARVSYLLDSIDFLRRSGRCSAAAAFGANLLSIKPCAAMVDGKIEVIKKYRGKGQAARLQYASEQLEKYNNYDLSAAFIYHSGVDGTEISKIREMLVSKGFKEIIIARTGCMISLHSAEGALGIHILAD